MAFNLHYSEKEYCNPSNEDANALYNLVKHSTIDNGKIFFIFDEVVMTGLSYDEAKIHQNIKNLTECVGDVDYFFIQKID